MASRLNKKTLKNAAAILFWVAVWQLASALVGKEILLSSPIDTLRAFFALLTTRDFYLSALNSLARILAGFALGAALGCLLAALSKAFSPIRALIAPVMHVIKATPVASFAILALMWVGARALSVFIALLMALPIVYSGALEGLDSADPTLIEMARVFRVSPPRRFRGIYLPAAYGRFSAACSLALGMCWKAGVAAEVIGLPDMSIGQGLYQAKIFWSTPELFAWTLAIILLSAGVTRLVARLLRALDGLLMGVR